MLHAIVDLLDNSVHIDSFVPWPDAYTASNKRDRNRSGHTRQDSLCTYYTVEDFEFLDILVHIYVHMMIVHKYKTIIMTVLIVSVLYSGKVWREDSLAKSMIRQTKTIQINTYY